jgi:type I restriction enzyme S subunit
MELKKQPLKKSKQDCPTEWPIISLGQLYDFKNGVNADKEAYGKGTPFINVLEAILNTHIDLTKIPGRVQLPRSIVELYSVQAGDVVFNRTSETQEEVGLSAVYLDSAPVVFGGFVIRGRPKTGSFVPEYAAYALRSNSVRSQIIEKGQGAIRSNIGQADLRKVKTSVPPIKEQRAIAEALSDTDTLIRSLDELIAKKRNIKQAVMQQLLTGKRRLPGSKGEWKAKTLFQIADNRKELFDDGDWVESEHISNTGVRLIQTGNIGIGTFIEKENRKYVYPESFDRLHCKELFVGDLLLCRLAEPAGRACVLPNISEERIITSVDVTIFRPNIDEYNRRFLSYVFSTNDWLKAVSELCGGTTHKRIARSKLGNIQILVPSFDEQNKIADFLSDFDAEITALEVQLKKTQLLKEGMMQVLLTGRIRLI